MRREHFRDRGCLSTPRLGAGPGDDRHFVEHDRDVLDENGIGQVGARVEALDEAAGLEERRLVRAMLHARQLDIDRHAIQVRQLARAERGAHRPGDGERLRHGRNDSRLPTTAARARPIRVIDDYEECRRWTPR